MNNLSVFQSQAKQLLKDFNAGKPFALNRVAVYIHDTSKFSLMKAQHVIAKEQGFNSWAELTKDTPEHLALVKQMMKYPTLTSSGFLQRNFKKTYAEWKKEFDEDRAELFSTGTICSNILSNYDIVLKIADWLRKNIEPIKTQNLRHTSYSHKHRMERMFDKTEPHHVYVSNGVFIAAAILAGFTPKPNGINCTFNMSERSWQTAYKKFKMY